MIESIFATCSPSLTSVNRALRSPIWTCEFTTPSSNSSLYASWALGVLVPSFVRPDTSIPSLKALATTAGFSNKIPLAPEKPKALIILRKCVGIEKTVFDNCETPFGNNNKFLYIQLTAASAPSLPSPLTKPWRPPEILLAFLIASAISFVVKLPCNGLITLPAPGKSFTISSTGTNSIPVVLDLNASSPASLLLQKNPLPPAACTSEFFAATFVR